LSCFLFSWFSFLTALCERPADCRSEGAESSLHIFSEMHAQRASSTLSEYREISACLRRLDDTECVFLFRNGKIIGIVAGDLQEDAAVRPSLIGLARGVQEARAKSQNSCDALFVSDLMADSFERRFILGVHRDVSQESEVISVAHSLEMQPQDLVE